ncbi:hypothetical protein ES703_119612 [subsurface metagenome]
MVNNVPVGPEGGESDVVATASAGVAGIASMSKARITAAAIILKNLLCFTSHLHYLLPSTVIITGKDIPLIYIIAEKVKSLRGG